MQKGEPEGARREGTARRSSKRKEAIIGCQFQMAAFTRTVAGEMGAVMTVELSQGNAAMAGDMLSREGGLFGMVM